MNRAEKRRQRHLAKKSRRPTSARGQPTNKSPGLQQALDLAVEHHNGGRLPEAEGIYLQILQADPDQPDALHLFGLLAHQAGKSDVAVDFITKALVLKPNYPEALLNLGNAFKKLGRLDEAVARYGKALTLKPDNAEAHINLGNTLKELGRLDEAVAGYHKALTLRPDYAEAHSNLGNTLEELGRLDEAVASYHKAIGLKPGYAEAHYNLGVALQSLGQWDGAVESHQKAIDIKPGFAEAHGNLGNALQELGRLDEAVASYRKHLAFKPGNAVAHYNLGNVLQEMGRLEDAAASYRQVLTLKPDDAEAHNNLGNTLSKLERFDEAVASYHKAIGLKPDYAEAHTNLGNAHQELGLLEEAVADYRQALAADPDFAGAHGNLGTVLKELGQLDQAVACFRQALTFKPDYDLAHSNLIFIQDLIPHIDQAAQQAERKLWNDKFILPLAEKIKAPANDPTPGRRLRIGYVSADFKRHSACQGFAPLILEHDRDHFEVICYAGNTVCDAITETLRAAATTWRSTLGQSDDQLAQTIRDDGIDILVDLSGHTRGNRLTVFGHKPAPLQVTGIGSTPPGVSTIDYRLTTDRTTSPEEESLFPEAPIYLETVIGFTPPSDTPPVGDLPCLESGFITFGCLNRFSKVTDQAMDLWVRILGNVSQSRLLIKAPQIDEPSIRQRVETFFSERGIHQDRLILLGRTSQREHLEACNRIDITLDTFPHGGGITTMESLWMGVPVVGLTDSSDHASRSISIICGPLGLDEWIAESTGEYHAIAMEWAGKRQALADLRPGLRQRVSEVYSRFPRDVEKAYRLIWKRWCTGEKPSPLSPL